MPKHSLRSSMTRSARVPSIGSAICSGNARCAATWPAAIAAATAVRDHSTAARELPAGLVCRELSAIARRYDPQGMTFAIIGGEPLIRRDVETVGAHAAALGFTWGVTTNAMLLDAGRLASLKAAGLRTISVSLDGLEEQHDTCAGATVHFAG